MMTIKQAVFVFLITAFMHSFSTQLLAQSHLTVDHTDTQIKIYQGGQLVLAYNIQSPPVPQGVDPIYGRSGFLHPVCTPKQACVTAAFPADHEHQQGIFSAWTQTEYDGKQIDFWNLAKKLGRVSHHRVIAVKPSKSKVEIEVELLHQITADSIIDVLKDHWTITVYATDHHFYCFDIDSEQIPLTNKPLYLPKYMYGGQGYRGPVAWLEPNDSYAQAHPNVLIRGCAMLTSERKDRIAGNHTHTRWVAVSGIPVSDDGSILEHRQDHATIAVLGHATNFRAPQPVRLHPTKPYICFSPQVDEPFTIEKPNTYKSKYRYLITSNPIDAEWIDTKWDEWHTKK